MRETPDPLQQTEHRAHLARRPARDVNKRQQFRRGATFNPSATLLDTDTAARSNRSRRLDYF